MVLLMTVVHCRQRMTKVLGPVSQSSSGTFCDREVVEGGQGLVGGSRALLPSSEEPSLRVLMDSLRSWKQPSFTTDTLVHGGRGTCCHLAWGSSGPQDLRKAWCREHSLSPEATQKPRLGSTPADTATATLRSLHLFLFPDAPPSPGQAPGSSTFVTP